MVPCLQLYFQSLHKAAQEVLAQAHPPRGQPQVLEERQPQQAQHKVQVGTELSHAMVTSTLHHLPCPGLTGSQVPCHQCV